MQFEFVSHIRIYNDRNTVNLSISLIGLCQVKKLFLKIIFCIFSMLLNQIMGIFCGPFEFFCLGGQYYGYGHPNNHPWFSMIYWFSMLELLSSINIRNFWSVSLSFLTYPKCTARFNVCNVHKYTLRA